MCIFASKIAKIMNKDNHFAIQLFEGKKVRIAWDAEQEKYYFAVADIVEVLTDSVNPRDYIKKMFRRPCRSGYYRILRAVDSADNGREPAYCKGRWQCGP